MKDCFAGIQAGLDDYCLAWPWPTGFSGSQRHRPSLHSKALQREQKSEARLELACGFGWLLQNPRRWE